MSPKEYLLKHGHIQNIGRGRISQANHEILAKAVASGIKIDNYSPVESTKPTGEKSIKNTAAPTNNEKVIADYTLRFALDTPAHAFWNGKKIEVSMRSACNNCRVSLVQCICGNTHVVAPNGSGPMRVYIEGDA